MAKSTLMNWIWGGQIKGHGIMIQQIAGLQAIFLKYGGLVVSAGFPEIGVPISRTGAIMKGVGVSMQIASDVAEGEYKDGGERFLIEAGSKVLGDYGSRYIKNLAKETRVESDFINNSLEITKDAAIDVTKSAIQETINDDNSQ